MKSLHDLIEEAVTAVAKMRADMEETAIRQCLIAGYPLAGLSLAHWPDGSTTVRVGDVDVYRVWQVHVEGRVTVHGAPVQP